AARHGPPRLVGTAASWLARGEARRRDFARLSHESRPHDRGRHGGDLEDDRGDTRARLAGKSLMDFRPSPAQQLLVATAREYLRRHCPIEPDQRVGLDVVKLWRGVAEL